MKIKKKPDPVRYDWDKLFKRDSFTVTRGIDYDCLPHGMAQQIRNEAARRKCRVSVVFDGDSLIVTVTKRKGK